MMALRILVPESRDDFERYFDLRWRILRAPWGQPRGSERDELEDGSWHRMACLDDRIPLGVARLHLNGPAQAQIRYMAVEVSMRRHGVGSALVQALEEQARLLGAAEIVLHAREDSRAFYERLGYRVERPSHLLFGVIRHYAMCKSLS